MEKIMKPASALLAAILICLLLMGCGSGGAKDVPVSQITDAVENAIDGDHSLVDADTIFLGFTKLDADALGEHAVMINAVGANVDEYGVFKAGAMSARDLKSAVDNYLSLRLDAWMEEYMPEEKPKLANAEVRTKGDYVMYCILSDADKTAAFKAFEDTLG